VKKEVNILQGVLEAFNGYKAEEVEEVDEESFDSSQRNRKSKRSANYTKTKDIALVKARQSVSLDAVTSND
jgi:hypothetical protein